MAIKDPNVLNKINTLNTNLENADIAKIEENISKRLFGVLEGSNSISVDSELYASIDKVAKASNISNYINTAKNSLPHNAGDRVSIKYESGDHPIDNTIIDLATLTGIDNTQNAINDMNNAIAGLNALPGQISALRTRLEENRRILNEIHNTQLDGKWTGRSTTDIQTDIDNENLNKNKCSELINILSSIENTEKNAAYLNSSHNSHDYYDNLHRNQVDDFNNNRGTIVARDYTVDGDFVNKRREIRTAQTNFDNNIRNLQQELRLSEDTARNENRLPTSNVAVPDKLGLFDTNDTKVNKSLLTSSTNTQTEIDHIDDRLKMLNVLEGQIEELRTRYQANLDKLKKILTLQQLEQRMNTTHPGEMRRRQNEFNTIRDISNNNLLLGNAAYEPELPNQSVNIGGVLGPIHLDFITGALGSGFNGGARTPTYSLCDEAGNPLKNNGGKLKIQQGGQTVSLGGITFDNTAQTMIINNLQVTPIEGLTFPLNLDLNVRIRIHDNDTGLDIDHHKPIHLEITRPTLVRADREAAYDSLVPPMNERIAAEYSDKYREGLETDAIWSILREGGNENEVNEIYNNETRRAMFIDRVRTALAGSIPLVGLAALQAGFRDDMTREDRDVPVQYLLGGNQFQNYVRQSIPGNLRDYASKAIRNSTNNQRDAILQEFLNFQTDIANNRVDKTDNLNVLASIPAERPEGHPKTFFQRLTGRESAQNNYTKFFQGRQAELKDLSLETEDGTINYGVKVEVAGINKLTATINIDGQDEPEIIDAPNHDELITGILNMANTKDGEPVNKRLLCNIALSVLKAMVLMSPQRLNRQIPTTNFVGNRGNVVSCNRVEAFVKGGNLRIRGGGVDGSRTRHNVTIFDEAQFKELQDENMLENGIRELSTQINRIMNATAQEYHEATSAVLKNDGNRYLMRYNTAERFRGGPIKRLWGRMIHGKTSNDFDFDNITVNEAGKTVNIKLEKGLFTVSGSHEGENFEYKSRNLGSILRKQKGRDFVFNGIELAMIAAINETFIQKLRKNHWVETENFVISDVNDGKTGRTYIFDSAGNLSYLEIEDVNLNPLGPGQTGRIDPNQIPTARRRCNEEERREFMQNPLLAGRLQRAMRRRLALF